VAGLLDTHVLLWLLEGGDRIGPRTRAAITQATRVHYSAASTWELTIKAGLGKLVLPDDIGHALDLSGLRELPVRAVHTWQVAALAGLDRHDPFDRLLVAQAHSEGLVLWTADQKLLALELEFIHDATR